MGRDCTPVLTPFSLIHSAEGNESSLLSSGYFGLNIDNIPGPEARQSHSGIMLAELSEPYPPIYSIPNEILSRIFESGCFEGDDLDVNFRALIEKVSCRWRETARHTPSIWSTYHLSQGNLDHLINDLPSFLKRSGDYPLSIHLNCFWYPARTGKVMDLFLPHSKRWKHLSITTPGSDIFRYLHGVPVPRLETVQISHFSSQRHLHLNPSLFDGHFPSLRHLALRNMTFKGTKLPLKALHSLDIRGYGIWPDFEELDDLIGGSTNLRDLTLHVRPEDVWHDINPRDGCTITLPALRSFNFITSEGPFPYIATLSQLFRGPVLETFKVKDNSPNRPVCDLVQYSRTGSASYPNTPSLCIRTCSLYHAWRSLSHSRNVTTLELNSIHWPHWSNCMTVFAALPMLQHMIITNVDPAVAFSDMGQPPHPLKVAKLNKLDIGFVKSKCDGSRYDIAKFVGAFDAPVLHSLAIRNVSGEQWKYLVNRFREVEKYPVLNSLTITDLHDLSNASPDPSLAFPNLENLNLIRSPVNSILGHLIIDPTRPTEMRAWPKLKCLTISGDPEPSTQLLHQITMSRPPQSLTISHLAP